MIDAIEAASGIEAKKTFGPEQPGDVKQTWADISKAQKLLNYHPKFDLTKGLEEFCAWFIDSIN